MKSSIIPYLKKKLSPPASNFWIKISKLFQVSRKVYTNVWSHFWQFPRLQTFLSRLQNFQLIQNSLKPECQSWWQQGPSCNRQRHLFFRSRLVETDKKVTWRWARQRMKWGLPDIRKTLPSLPSLYLGISGHIFQLAQKCCSDWHQPTNSTKFLLRLTRKKIFLAETFIWRIWRIHFFHEKNC